MRAIINSMLLFMLKAPTLVQTGQHASGNYAMLEDAVESSQDTCTQLISYLNHADTLPPDQLPLEAPLVFHSERMRVHHCGIVGSFEHVNCLCCHHRITQGSILVACDNPGALKPGAVDFLPKYSQKNLDLLQAIWKTLQESPIEWTTQHVYGHQDRKAKDSHRRLAALNCEMDALAKQHWARIYAKVQLTPARVVHR